MSVTFSVTQEPVGYRLRCGFSPTVYDTWDEAIAAVAAHGNTACGDAIAWDLTHADLDWSARRALCDAHESAHGARPDDCEHFVSADAVYAEEAPSLNVSNANAAEILHALGLDAVDLCGSLSGEDLLGRVLVGLGAGVGDPGRPVTVDAAGGSRFIDCGRRPGYVEDRLGDLHEVASWAAARNTDVTWG